MHCFMSGRNGPGRQRTKARDELDPKHYGEINTEKGREQNADWRGDRREVRRKGKKRFPSAVK